MRTGAFFVGLPFLTGKMVPMQVRAGFALLLTILLMPFVPVEVECRHHFKLHWSYFGWSQ